MNTRFRTTGILALVLAVLLSTGCRKTEPGPTAASGDDLQQFYSELTALLEEGQTNTVIALLDAQLDDPAWSEFRGILFRNLLHMLLEAGQTDEAELRLFAVAQDEDLAPTGVGMLYSFHRQAGRGDMSDWTRRLLGAGFPESMRPQLLVWHGQALCAESLFEDLSGSWLPMVKEQTGPESAHRVLATMLRHLLSSSAHEQVEVLARQVDALFTNAAPIRSLVAVVRTESLTARREWSRADAHVRDSAGLLDDNAVLQCLQMLSRAIRKDSGEEQLAGLYTFVIDTQGDKTRSAAFAAERWIQAAIERKDVAAILDRFDKVVDRAAAPRRLARMLRDAAYIVLETGAPETKRRLMQLADTMEETLQSDSDRAELRLMRLDAAFLANDYARAIALIEAGIPDQDEGWHAMALRKLRAHLALKNGNTNEAVRHFRGFMAAVETWETPERDPATGMTYTKEMTLGFNAKRIGGLLAAAADAEGARGAYAEARAYYEKALQELKQDSAEYTLVQKEMAEIPSDR